MNTCGQAKYGRNAYPSQTPCQRNDWPGREFALAMAYVPIQRLHGLYELEEGLAYGTIFPELNKPFMGWRGGRPC